MTTKVVALTDTDGHRAYCQLCDYNEPFVFDSKNPGPAQVWPAALDPNADSRIIESQETTYAAATIAAWKHDEACPDKASTEPLGTD